MKAGRRLWRTKDGGLVDDGHPTAAFLAYAAGDDLSRADEAMLHPPAPVAEIQAEPGPEVAADDMPAASAVKARPPAANKARKPAANK